MTIIQFSMKITFTTNIISYDDEQTIGAQILKVTAINIPLHSNILARNSKMHLLINSDVLTHEYVLFHNVNRI